jgi:hypothetical protein
MRCVCGHPRSRHEHYRGGRDCGICGGNLCPRFRWRWLHARAWRWQHGVKP